MAKKSFNRYELGNLDKEQEKTGDGYEEALEQLTVEMEDIKENITRQDVWWAEVFCEGEPGHLVFERCKIVESAGFVCFYDWDSKVETDVPISRIMYIKKQKK